VWRAVQGAEPLPITRLAGATFQVQDLEKSRQFYGAILGYPDASNVAAKSVYRLNSDQFLEFTPGAPENFRLLYVTMTTPDVGKLGAALAERGVTVNRRNGFISIQDPEKNEIRFVRSPSASQPKPGGFSSHLLHVGLNSDHENASMALYRDVLGFHELQRGGPSAADIRWIIMDMPAAADDWVEIMVAREQPPTARQHICFEVSDTQSTYKELTSRGLPGRFKPLPAQNHRMIMNLRDPNGLRVEIMGEATQHIPQ
jgi:catechol 2,3-dioxygenase-like lactoylglutathione lyase family enzyme